MYTMAAYRILKKKIQFQTIVSHLHRAASYDVQRLQEFAVVLQ